MAEQFSLPQKRVLEELDGEGYSWLAPDPGSCLLGVPFILDRTGDTFTEWGWAQQALSCRMERTEPILQSWGPGPGGQDRGWGVMSLAPGASPAACPLCSRGQ